MKITIPDVDTSPVRRRAMALLVFAGSAFTFSLPVASAQTAATATLLGTVTDPAAAVVAGAAIEVTDVSRHETRRQTANADGAYSITGILAGIYSVSASAEGFRESIVPTLTVDVSKSHVVNFQLVVGARAELIEVKAGASVEMQTLDSTVGEVIQGRLSSADAEHQSLRNHLLRPSAADGALPRNL
jgi:hypothetical protein